MKVCRTNASIGILRAVCIDDQKRLCSYMAGEHLIYTSLCNIIQLRLNSTELSTVSLQRKNKRTNAIEIFLNHFKDEYQKRRRRGKERERDKDRSRKTAGVKELRERQTERLSATQIDRHGYIQRQRDTDGRNFYFESPSKHGKVIASSKEVHLASLFKV